MNSFCDWFFGIAIICAVSIYMLSVPSKTTAHVYDAQQERAMSFVDCLFDKLEGDFSNEQYDQAERDCRS